MWLKRVALICLFVVGICLVPATNAIAHLSISQLALHDSLITASNPFTQPRNTKPRGNRLNVSPNLPNSSPLNQRSTGQKSNFQPAPLPSPSQSPDLSGKHQETLNSFQEASDPCQKFGLSFQRTDQTPDDKLYCLQWNFRKYPGINVEPAWDITQGENSTYAVIDTGVSLKQGTDFEQSRFRGGWDYVANPPRAIEEANKSIDNDGHGTHIAGTAGQATKNGLVTAGIAYKANLMSMRVNLKPDTEGDKSDEHIAEQLRQIDDAIRRATDKGANVINLSLQGITACNSGIQSPNIQDAAAYAYSKGVVLVAAVGNSQGLKTYPIFQDTFYNPDYSPSNTDSDRIKCGSSFVHGMIVAASNGSSNDGRPITADYSNDAGANIYAPGGDLSSVSNAIHEGCVTEPADLTKIPNSVKYGIAQAELVAGQGLRVRFCQGSSQAAAHVSGVATLVVSILKDKISHNSRAFPDLVISILEESAHIADYDQRAIANNQSRYEHGDHEPGEIHPLDAEKAVKLATFVAQRFQSRHLADLTTQEINNEVAQVVKENLSSLSNLAYIYIPSDPSEPLPSASPQSSPSPNPLVVIGFLGVFTFFSYRFWRIRFIAGVVIGFVTGGLILWLVSIIPFLQPLPTIVAVIAFTASPILLVGPFVDDSNRSKRFPKRGSLFVGSAFGLASLFLLFTFLAVSNQAIAGIAFGIVTSILCFLTACLLSEKTRWFAFAASLGVVFALVGCSILLFQLGILGIVFGIVSAVLTLLAAFFSFGILKGS